MVFPKLIKTHSPREVHDLLAQGAAVLIDVREHDEHAQQAIADAHLHPLSRFDPAKLPKWTGKTLILHCKSGMRSDKAAKLCLEAGITDVTHMDGGIMAWSAASLPIEAGK